MSGREILGRALLAWIVGTIIGATTLPIIWPLI